MKKLLISILLISIFSKILIQAQPTIDYKPFPEWAWHQQGSTQYYLYTPKNIPAGHLCPIVIFLHGCCGVNDSATPRNCVDPGARVWHNFGANTQPEPTYIFSPATSSGWDQHFTDIVTAVNALVTAKQVDPQRIYINGFSMGGFGTWDFINDYPTYFAGAAPMGCTPSGPFTDIENLPIFQNTSNQDFTFSNPATEVADFSAIRALHGYDKGGEQWETGVNPRWHMYDGTHGTEQYMSTQEQGYIQQGSYIWYSHLYDVYQNWMLTKINDGNAYPSVWFESPNFIQMVTKGSTVPVKISATDDGSIAKIMFYANNIYQGTLTTKTNGYYQTIVKINNCETLLSATAYDNLGKTSTTSILVRTNEGPIITTTELPEGEVGSYYYKRLFAIGNEGITFKLAPNSAPLPNGLTMTDDGIISGIPIVSGTTILRFTITDNLNDSVTKGGYALTILPKNPGEVLVTNMITKYGSVLPAYKMKLGALPWSGMTFTTYSQTATYQSTEDNFSNTIGYDGLTYIQTPSNAQEVNDSSLNYLTFNVDVPVTVYVAYEYKDSLQTSTVPTWLSSGFTKVSNQEIVIQYFYCQVYRKNFPAGTITLPGANSYANNVANNYFVMVSEQNDTLKLIPEVTTSIMPNGYVGYRYTEQLTNLFGIGVTTWSLVSGSLPDSMSLAADGTISGTAMKAGTYIFTVQITDSKGSSATKTLSIQILSVNPKLLFVHVDDTIIIRNSGPHLIVLNNVTNGNDSAQNCTVKVMSANDSLISVDTPVKINATTYSFHITPDSNQIGNTTVFFTITDHTNPDTVNNTFSAGFNVTVIPLINKAPTCNPIPNDTTGMNYSSVKQVITFTGVNDGNDDNGAETIDVTLASSKSGIVRALTAIYTSGTTGTITFYPLGVGTTDITLKLKNSGDTALGGNDSLLISFSITVLSTYTDVQTNKFNDIQIYPNPANNVLYLELPEELKTSCTISIIDILGIKEAEYSNISEINTQNFVSGNYLVVISNNEGFIYKTLIRIQK